MGRPLLASPPCWLLPLLPPSSWLGTVLDTELLPDTASLTVSLATDLPMALSDTVLAMLWPMPHLSSMLPLTLLRSPPTPTTTEWLTNTLELPSASPRATIAPVLLRAPTRWTFLTAVSKLSTTTPTTMTVTSPTSPTPELPWLMLPLWFMLLPTLLLLLMLLPLSMLDTASLEDTTDSLEDTTGLSEVTDFLDKM